MSKDEAGKAAIKMYDGQLGNVPQIAERLSTVTKLTRARAEAMLRSALIDYVADLMLDYGADE